MVMERRCSMQVYLLLFKNGLRYVGCHSTSAQERFSEHRRRALQGRSQAPLYKAWREFGEPELQLIAEASNVEEMHLLEMVWIQALEAIHPNGLNLSPGGSYNASSHPLARESFAKAKRGSRASAETRLKMSASHKGRVCSDETKAKISAANRKS